MGAPLINGSGWDHLGKKIEDNKGKKSVNATLDIKQHRINKTDWEGVPGKAERKSGNWDTWEVNRKTCFKKEGVTN